MDTLQSFYLYTDCLKFQVKLHVLVLGPHVTETCDKYLLHIFGFLILFLF